MECLTGFGEEEVCGCGTGLSKLSFDTTAVRYSPGLNFHDKKVQIFECLAVDDDLIDLFAKNYEEDPHDAWQYVGTVTGMHMTFPGSDMMYSPQGSDICQRLNDECPITYDPRKRPWFVDAAAGGKDIYILLDVSESSKKYRRLEIMKSAAKHIIEVSGRLDRISVISFYGEVSRECIPGLVPATKENIETWESCIDEIQPGPDKADYSTGFEKAFKVIDEASSNEYICHKIMFFFSAGGTNLGYSDEPAFIDLRKTIPEDLHVFTASVGIDANHDLLKSLACNHLGHWTELGDILTTDSIYWTEILQFIRFFSYCEGDHDHQHAIWTDVYEDASDLGWMVTIALPCYIRDELIAVAGIDVLLSGFRDFRDGSLGNISDSDFFDQYVYNYIVQREACDHDDHDITEAWLEPIRTNKCSVTKVKSTKANKGGVAVLVVFLLLCFVVCPVTMCLGVGITYYVMKKRELKASDLYLSVKDGVEKVAEKVVKKEENTGDLAEKMVEVNIK